MTITFEVQHYCSGTGKGETTRHPRYTHAVDRFRGLTYQSNVLVASVLEVDEDGNGTQVAYYSKGGGEQIQNGVRVEDRPEVLTHYAV